MIVDGFHNVPIVPDLPQKVLEAVSAPGALDMRDWHTCDSTHCWAGWIVHIAGRRGYALEAEVRSTSYAAVLIAEASGCPVPAPWESFFTTNQTAMMLMKEWAS